MITILFRQKGEREQTKQMVWREVTLKTILRWTFKGLDVTVPLVWLRYNMVFHISLLYLKTFIIFVYFQSFKSPIIHHTIEGLTIISPSCIEISTFVLANPGLFHLSTVDLYKYMIHFRIVSRGRMLFSSEIDYVQSRKVVVMNFMWWRDILWVYDVFYQLFHHIWKELCNTNCNPFWNFIVIINWHW